MECPFQVGDDVVCLDASGPVSGFISEDAVYTVTGVLAPDHTGVCGLRLAGVPRIPFGSGFPSARRFRKVQKPRTTLSIESFLTIKPDQFEEPRRAPAKTPEKADA